MNLLLDTCAFLWLAQQPDQLSPKVLDTMNNSSTHLHVSDASILEVTIKHSVGKLPLPDLPRSWIPEKLQHHQVENQTLFPEVFYLSGELAYIHPDPFDRLIAAQAILGGMTILSPDHSFSELGASRMW